MKIAKSYGKTKKSKRNIMRKKQNELDTKLEKNSSKLRRLAKLNSVTRRKNRPL